MSDNTLLAEAINLSDPPAVALLPVNVLETLLVEVRGIKADFNVLEEDQLVRSIAAECMLVVWPGFQMRWSEMAQATKDPGIAAVLSFFCTGLGQIYNGEILKGLVLMCIQLVNLLLVFVLIGFITFPIVWVYGIWDAHETSKKSNAEAKS